MTEPMDENQFKEMTYAKHREHFDYFYRLHQLAQESLGKYRGFTGSHYQAALQLIFPRAYKSFDSIRRLCEVASCEDAAVILRCLLNLTVVTRWISVKPQSRARKYLAWYWVEMNREAEQSPSVIPTAWVADVHKHYQAVRHLFEHKDKQGRTRKAKQWYEPEAKSIFDLFKRGGPGKAVRRRVQTPLRCRTLGRSSLFRYGRRGRTKGKREKTRNSERSICASLSAKRLSILR